MFYHPFTHTWFHVLSCIQNESFLFSLSVVTVQDVNDHDPPRILILCSTKQYSTSLFMFNYPLTYTRFCMHFFFFLIEYILWLSDCYFHGKWSEELHSLVPSGLTFTARTGQSTYIVGKYLNFLHIPSVRIFIRKASSRDQPLLHNRLPRWCFQDHFNFNLFKSRINRYICHLSV